MRWVRLRFGRLGMVVVWMVAHVVEFDAIPHYVVQTLTLRSAIERVGIERERRGVRRRSFRRVSGVGGVSSVLDGLDECRDIGVAIDARLFGFSVNGHVGHTAYLSKCFFDSLFAVAASHSLDGDGRRHTRIRTSPTLMRISPLNKWVIGNQKLGNKASSTGML